MVPIAAGYTVLGHYRGVVEPLVVERVEQLGQRLAGLRVIHVNATPVGGGVAEILRSLVPLMNAAGLQASWFVLDPAQEFFAVTKKLHNALQGKPVAFSQAEMDLYWAHNERIAEEVRQEAAGADIIVLHDAQLLPTGAFLDNGSRLVWHCHVDLTTADQFVRRELLEPLTRQYSRCVVSMPEYVDAGLPAERTLVFPPAIDPFMPKNRRLALKEARRLVAALGIDWRRPLLVQVSRFDPWKDPWGVIDAYRHVKRGMPQLQLALIGALMAQDDPEGAEILDSVRAYAAGDPDIYIVSDPALADDLTVNAVQTVADVVVQKSVREGFGLTVSEAMWKEKPVIGGNCGGIRLQIEDGVSGYLVNSPAECAERIALLLSDGALAQRMGVAARQRARQMFLMPRLLLDYLGLFEGLVSRQAEAAGVPPAEEKRIAVVEMAPVASPG